MKKLASKKMIAAYVAIAATIAAHFGFDLDGEVAALVLTAVLTAIGISGPKKPKPPTKLAAVLIVALVLPGCASLKRGARAAASASVGCLKAEAVNASAELGPALRPLVVAAVAGARPDWGPVADLAKSWSLELGGCVGATVAAEVAAAIHAAPRTFAQQLDPEAVLAGMRAVLAARFGAHTYETSAGPL